MNRPRRPIALAALVAVLLTAVLAMAGPASAKKAKSLGPTPLSGDCKFYQRPSGGPECYQGPVVGPVRGRPARPARRRRAGRQGAGHGRHVSRVLVAEPRWAGLDADRCPETAPTPPEGHNLVGWSTTCTFKATRRDQRLVDLRPVDGARDLQLPRSGLLRRGRRRIDPRPRAGRGGEGRRWRPRQHLGQAEALRGHRAQRHVQRHRHAGGQLRRIPQQEGLLRRQRRRPPAQVLLAVQARRGGERRGDVHEARHLLDRGHDRRPVGSPHRRHRRQDHGRRPRPDRDH